MKKNSKKLYLKLSFKNLYCRSTRNARPRYTDDEVVEKKASLRRVQKPKSSNAKKVESRLTRVRRNIIEAYITEFAKSGQKVTLNKRSSAELLKRLNKKRGSSRKVTEVDLNRWVENDAKLSRVIFS